MLKQIYLISIAIILLASISCQKSDTFPTIINDSIVLLRDKQFKYYEFKLFRETNTVYYTKSIVERNINNKSIGQIKIMVDTNSLEKLLYSNQLWYIPILEDTAFRIKNNYNNSLFLNQRLLNSNITYKCFCEIGEPSSICVMVTPANQCIWHQCDDCDIEMCINLFRIPGTRGGGIVISADTVIYLGNKTQTIFGGRTKIEYYTSNDTTYFKRSYVSDSVLFDQCVFNATAASLDSFETGINYWLLPFDKGISAIQVGDPPSCISSTTEPCSSCDFVTASNGCLRCFCTSPPGDCDLKVNSSSLVNGIILKSSYIFELE